MTLIRRYAIEPSALCKWQDFRYVMEKMSFSKGRVMVALPKRWVREFLDHLDVGDIERARFVERLRRYKEDRIISAKGGHYNPDIRWIDNLQFERCEGIADAVLISQKTKDADPSLLYPTPAEIDEDFFANRRELRCLNTAESLLNVAQTLLEISSYAILVDPYFYVGRKSCLSVLLAFVKHAATSKNCRCITVVTDIEAMPKAGEIGVRKSLEREISAFATSEIQLRFCFVDKTAAVTGFHARYLLATKGGLRYDKGFSAQHPPELVDVSLLDQEMHRELLDYYHPDTSKLPIMTTWHFISGV